MIFGYHSHACIGERASNYLRGPGMHLHPWTPGDRLASAHTHVPRRGSGASEPPISTRWQMHHENTLWRENPGELVDVSPAQRSRQMLEHLIRDDEVEVTGGEQ